jgi:hypothetical protein
MPIAHWQLVFADVLMNSGTSCTSITASAKPPQPPLVGRRFLQASHIALRVMASS